MKSPSSMKMEIPQKPKHKGQRGLATGCRDEPAVHNHYGDSNQLAPESVAWSERKA